MDKTTCAALLLVCVVASGCTSGVGLQGPRAYDSYADPCSANDAFFYVAFSRTPANRAVNNPSAVLEANGQSFAMSRVTGASGQALDAFERRLVFDPANPVSSFPINHAGKLRFRYVLRYWDVLPFPMGIVRRVKSGVIERPFGVLDWNSDSEIEVVDDLLDSDEFGPLHFTAPDRRIAESYATIPGETGARNLQFSLSLRNRLPGTPMNVASIAFIRSDGTTDTDFSMAPAPSFTLAGGAQQVIAVTYARTLASGSAFFSGHALVVYEPGYMMGCRAEMRIPVYTGWYPLPP